MYKAGKLWGMGLGLPTCALAQQFNYLQNLVLRKLRQGIKQHINIMRILTIFAGQRQVHFSF